MHFGASAVGADARRRDADDVVTSSRSGNAADAPTPPRPSGLRPISPLALLLAPHIPQSIARRSRLASGLMDQQQSVYVIPLQTLRFRTKLKSFRGELTNADEMAAYRS